MILNNKKLTILTSTANEKDFLDDKLIEFNSKYIQFNQKSVFTHIDYTVKDEHGNIIGGITSILYAWGCLYIDTLWVDEAHRNHGIGSMLLNKVEAQAKEIGCSVANLNTFDFQAKDFYMKMGYDIFGVLENCAPGHKLYFLKKTL